MAAQTINGKILLRNDTATNWVTKNPTLGVGEVGIETDTGKAKVGDGTTAWNSLGYSFGIYNITEGSTNGTISVDGTDVSVHGLGSNAFNSTSYLPLSGGTMTGAITTSAVDFIKKTSNTNHLTILGGTEFSNSASLMVAGGSQSYAPGYFELKAQDGSNSSALTGKPDGTLTWKNQPLLPVGVVQAFAGSTIPNGWLLCDGSAVSRTTYANLFACIGTTYGTGDGSTTFNLPNLVDKFIEGSSTSGTVKSAGLPNITGDTAAALDNMGPTGAFVWLASSAGTYHRAGTEVGADHFGFDASQSNSIYGNSTTVQPPALTMRYVIKY